MAEPSRTRLWHYFAVLGPGILVAATGVGAGDLLTAALAGSHVGVVVLWAAWLGALGKWTLSEGIARWQMATGTTLLEGWVRHLGPVLVGFFLVYLLVWSFVVGGALISACGVAGAAVWDGGDPHRAKVFWGLGHSLLGVVFVLWGGFVWFQRCMAACVGVMFVLVLAAAVMMPQVDWLQVVQAFIPQKVPAEGVAWTLGVLGGVGGTVTLLSYGYWVAHHQRQGPQGLRLCHLDLAAGYAMTALFGMAMVIIGSRFTLQKDPLLALELTRLIQQALGPWGAWAFLLGFWAAVFSSLLGVWQSVPYLFAHLCHLWGDSQPSRQEPDPESLERSWAYRGYLVFLATIPCVLLGWKVQGVQKLYAVLGALFMPFLALTLLVLNNSRWVEPRLRNPWWINLLLLGVLGLFAYLGGLKLLETLG